MPYSYKEVTGDGTTAVYTIAFSGPSPGYISEDHIFVTYDTVLQDQANREFITEEQVKLLNVPVSGTTIRIYRNSSIKTALVDFEGGSTLSEANLDKNTTQMLMLAQESYDKGGTSAEDLAIIAAAAALSAQNAAISANTADLYANAPEDSEVAPGKYSGLHYLTKSEAIAATVALNAGDMLEADYDVDGDGTVDSADTAAALTGTQATAIETNTTHKDANGSSHSHVVLNSAHVAIVTGENPHNTLPNVTDDAQLKVSQLEQTVSDDAATVPSGAAVTAYVVSASGADMLKSVYDTDADGTVDSADTSAALTGTQAAEIVVNSAHAALVAGNPHAVTATEIGLGNVTNFEQLPVSYLETTITDSDVKVPSSKAVTTAITAAAGTENAYIANVRDYGATGDYNFATSTGTDDTAAIVAALATLATTGGVLYFPGGNYLTDTITITSAGVLEYSPKISVKGDGKGVTSIVTNVGQSNGIVLSGPGGESGAESKQYLRDFTVTRSAGYDAYTGIGIYCSDMAWVSIENVTSMWFQYGFYGIDYLSSWFYGCEFRDNQFGMRVEYGLSGAFTHTNAVNLNSCIIGRNLDYGAIFNDVNTLNITGGSIEGNGITPIGASAFGIFIGNSGVQGAVGVNMTGTHIESNSGTADVWINNTKQQSVHTFTGVTFARVFGPADTYGRVSVTNNVLVESATTDLTANFVGCGFYGLDTYEASASYMTIAKAGTSTVINNYGSDFSDAINTPVFDNVAASGDGIAERDVSNLYDSAGVNKVVEVISSSSAKVNGALTVTDALTTNAALTADGVLNPAGGVSQSTNEWNTFKGLVLANGGLSTTTITASSTVTAPALTINGNITVSGTVDGVDLSSLGSLTSTQKADLTDGGSSTLHYHAADRARAVHTGTQLASTISNFSAAVGANSAVATSTALLNGVGFQASGTTLWISAGGISYYITMTPA